MSQHKRKEILENSINTLRLILENGPKSIKLPEDIGEETAFESIDGLDSLDSVELVARLEEEYQIWMKSNEWVEMQTLGDLCTYIERGLAES